MRCGHEDRKCAHLETPGEMGSLSAVCTFEDKQGHNSPLPLLKGSAVQQLILHKYQLTNLTPYFLNTPFLLPIFLSPTRVKYKVIEGENNRELLSFFSPYYPPPPFFFFCLVLGSPRPPSPNYPYQDPTYYQNCHSLYMSLHLSNHRDIVN